MLLLLDNFAAHLSAVEKLENLPAGEGLRNTEICWLPPNSTSMVQPLDQGIIRAFKAHYRAQWLQYMVDEYEANNNPLKTMNLLKTIRFSVKAWSELTIETVRNCWSESTVNGRPIGPPTKRQFERRSYLYPAQLPLEEQEQASLVQKLADELAKRQRIVQAMGIQRLLEPVEEEVDNLEEDEDIEAQIIAQFEPRPEFEDGEVLEELPLITAAQALQALYTLRLYEEQSKQGLLEWIQQLNKHEKVIRRRQFESLKQRDISSFFE